MSTRKIKIGNMCCSRCVTAVQQVFDQLGIKQKKVEIGLAEIILNSRVNVSAIENALNTNGFEIIRSKDEKTSESIKIAIHKIFFESELGDLNDFDLKKYLEMKTGLSYKKLSDVFSKQNKKTIENCFIAHRIEKAKAMIDDTDHSFSEIAFKLGYRSLSHLSRQFKGLEGGSMHDYRLKHNKQRKSIDEI